MGGLKGSILTILCSLGATVFPPSTGALDPVQLTFTGCTEQFAAYPVPEALLAPLLPEGFEANPFSLLPVNDVGSVPIFVQRCQRVEAGESVVADDVLQAWLMIWVQPPIAWRDPTLNAYYFVIQGFAQDAPLANLYAAWGLEPDGAATITMERSSVVGNTWVDRARMEKGGVTIDMVNANAVGFTPLAGLRARFFAQAADGSIHAADHRELPGGGISGIQPSTALGDLGASPIVGPQAGLGRTFAWSPDQPSWTFARVDLPP